MPTPKVRRFTSWSYSRLGDYETCALKAKLKHLDKLKEPEGPALLNGSRVHKLAECFILKAVPEVEEKLQPFMREFKKAADGLLPTELETFTEELRELRAHNKEVQVEVDAAFTRDWEPTTWDDWAGCWLRGKLDVLCLRGDHADVRDWKTGKRKAEHVFQLDLYALAVFCKHPQVKDVTARLCYLDLGEEVARTYARKLDHAKLKKAWSKRPLKMLADTVFVPTPGSHCRFCFFGQSGRAKGGPGLCKF